MDIIFKKKHTSLEIYNEYIPDEVPKIGNVCN